MRCFLLILFSFISQSLWAIEQSPRPMSRPELALKPAVTDSLRPNLRPRSVEDRAQRYRAALVRGQVCGDVRLQGKVMGRVSHKTRGCGIDNAVRVTSIDGVRLSQPVTLDCKTAKTFAHWVERSAQPVIGTLGGGLDVSILWGIMHAARATIKLVRNCLNIVKGAPLISVGFD